MEITIHKPKCTKGLSYVLKTSVLESALKNLDLDLDVIIRYGSTRQHPAGIIIFSCDYWLPNNNVPRHRLHIIVGAVYIQYRKVVNEALENTFIPQFARWAKLMNDLPDNSTLLKHNSCFKITFKDGELIAACRPAF